MGKGFVKKKKQARMMQEKFQKLQEEMRTKEIVGAAGNGLVTVTLNGEYEMLSIKIKPECVDPEDVEGLEDLIKAAYNDASAKMKSEGAGDFSFPEGMGDLSGFSF